ncbi:MAG TPA: hypothetical protein VF200_12465 [Woeseiaceae bacterium]
MRKLILPVALLAVAGAAGIAWYALNDARNARRVLADVPSMSAAEARAERENRYGAIGDIEALLALPGHFARMEALYTLAGRSDSAAVQNLIFQADGIADPSLRREVLLVLFDRLAELDPLSALALAGTPGFAAQPDFEREVWRRWGELDADAALAYAATLEGMERARAAQGLFAAAAGAEPEATMRIADRLDADPDNRTRSLRIDDLASGDPAAAVAYVRGLESALERHRAAAHLGLLLGRNGLEAADRWAARFQEPELRRAFEDAAAQSAAEVDPAGTLERLLAAEGAKGNRSRLAAAFGAVAARDVQQALQWFERIDDPGQRRAVARTVAVQLAQSDPEAALAWAQKHDGSIENRLYAMVIGVVAETNPELAIAHANGLENRWQRMAAFGTLAERLSENDPQRAAQMADSMDDRELRSMMLQRVAMNWLQSDPQAALDWVLSADFGNRDEVMMSAAFTLARSDLDAAIALLPRLDERSAPIWRQQIAANLAAQRSIAEARSFIARFEGTPGYSELVSGMVQGLVRNDPGMAIDLLKEIPDEGQRQMLAAQVFMMYAHRSPRDAAEDVARLSGDAERASAMRMVMSQWSRSDPQAAERWVERLPRGPDRDGAIAGAAGEWDDLTPSRRRLIETIGSVEQRRDAITQIVFRIARDDPERAEQALLSFNLPDEQRDMLLQHLRNSPSFTSRGVVIRSW